MSEAWTPNYRAYRRSAVLDWLIEQCFTSPPTQYRLYGRRFLQVKRPNQQYQSTEGTKNNTQITEKYTSCTHITKKTGNPLVYTNMGWLGDGSHGGQGRQAWMAVGLLPRYPLKPYQHEWHCIDQAIQCRSCWYTLENTEKYTNQKQTLLKLSATQKKQTEQHTTTLVQSPFTTLSQETRSAYSTMLPSPYGATNGGHLLQSDEIYSFTYSIARTSKR